jgi:hypothetical protein
MYPLICVLAIQDMFVSKCIANYYYYLGRDVFSPTTDLLLGKDSVNFRYLLTMSVRKCIAKFQ